LAAPILRYSFIIINWHQEEIQGLDRNTRKILTIYAHCHRRADSGCLYVPRKEGGRGLIQIEGAYIAEVVKLMECVDSKEDTLIKIVRTHHHTHSILLETVKDFK
jgi:hypothetical protein